jgi:ParB family transcriptional regulator, chromosome partitioning protein
MGGGMSRQKNTSLQMIPVEKVNVLNPRVRNAKLFDGIVQNIARVGLKRPITVTPSRSKAEGKEYDLVCGQGRLEAFMACGQTMIPADVINASEERALIMSLVENIVRRQHRPIDLLQGVEILRKQGYDAKAIATKIGHCVDYINRILLLLDQGEELLVSAVETGRIPITLAFAIVQSPKTEQAALQQAYETGELSGHKFMTAKRLLEERRRSGKAVRGARKRGQTTKDSAELKQEILKTYTREVTRKQLLERKADRVNENLISLTEALYRLMKEDHFTTLLRAEGLETMPKQLAEMIAAKEH